MAIVKTPKPTCCAVIFTSRHTKNEWKDKESIKAWRNHKKHKKAKKRARAIWYEKYFLRIAKVENNYGKI